MFRLNWILSQLASVTAPFAQSVTKVARDLSLADLSALRPAVQQRLQRRFNRPEKWDFRSYAGDGFGWFQSRRTGELSLHKITVRNASSHVKKLYELE